MLLVVDKEPQVPKQLSITPQAFKLLEDEKTLVDVAIFWIYQKSKQFKYF